MRWPDALWVSVLLICMTFLLSGCAFMPNEAVPYTPPASYAAVWAEAEACTGHTGDFNRVAFYKMPGDSFDHSGDEVVGVGTQKRIFISEKYIDHPMVVKHEMIHILIGGGHPDHPFKDPCKATWDTWAGSERLVL